MPVSTLKSVSQPLAPELLRYDSFERERYCHTALFGTIHGADTKVFQQTEILVSGINTLAKLPDNYHLPPRGFGQIARIECLWDTRSDLRSDHAYRGMIIFTSGASSTIPVVHFADALLGYDGSGATLARDILKYCGISAGLIAECEDDLEHHDYQIVFSREATYVQDGIHVAYPWIAPDKEWMMIRRDKQRR